MNMSKIGFAVALTFTSLAANAATSTGDFTVSTNVAAACDVSASPLTFADVNPLNSSATNATSTVAVTCSNGTPYTIGLNAGGAAGATVNTRQMTGGAGGTDSLNYALYLDSNRSTNWDDIGGSGIVEATGTGGAQNQIVYGQIPGSQTGATTGAYSDTVTVSVSY
jgi:spore coat protein U-like protein